MLRGSHARAHGKFVVELPSAALPLLVSDLSTFVWWRATVQLTDKVFLSLMDAADRLAIDSAEFSNLPRDLVETHRLFSEDLTSSVGITDLNWARLTSWRGLLADFYDVPAYQELLGRIDVVRIEYVGPESAPEAVAPQALLVAGWLASRLAWQPRTSRRSSRTGRRSHSSFGAMTRPRGHGKRHQTGTTSCRAAVSASRDDWHQWNCVPAATTRTLPPHLSPSAVAQTIFI